MNWRAAVAPIFKNHSREAKNQQYAAIAEENDFAEDLGFKCTPDKNRGHGWCKFTKDNVTVWGCRDGWCRAELIDNKYENHHYFRTLSQALENDSPHAHLNELGCLVYEGQDEQQQNDPQP